MNHNDYLAVHETLSRYATALDEKRWVLLKDVFTPDAVVEYKGIGGCRGIGEIMDIVSGVLSQCGATQHALSNIRIHIDGGTAKARCYLNAFHRGMADYRDNTMMVRGQYADSLLRTAYGWRIAERKLAIIDVEGDIGIPEFTAFNAASR